MTTVLTTATGYDTKNIQFSKPEVGSIKNGDGPDIKYKRIKLSTKNSDGSVGDLIVPTSEVFSYGVQENISPESGKVNGYIMALCLWSKNGPTDEETQFTNTFNNIVERCKNHLINNKDDLELYELDNSELKKFNPLYWKKEKGKIVEGKGPTLYAKLISSTKKNTILTLFSDDETNEDIPALELLKKYCYVTGAVKFESIYIGNKISLQVKLHEGVVRRLTTGVKRLLTNAPPRPTPVAAVSVDLDSVEKAMDNSSDGEDDGSLQETSSESEQEQAPTPPPKVVKRKVVRKNK